MTLPKADPTMTLCPYIHGEKTSKAPEQAIDGLRYFVIEGGELQDPLHSHPFSTLCCPKPGSRPYHPTGFANLEASLGGKWLELLSEDRARPQAGGNHV
jgi:hypothetical protein